MTDFLPQVNEILSKGEEDKHIHMITMSRNGQKLEFVYSNGKVEAASLILGNGRYELLGTLEREAIAKAMSMQIDGTVFY